MATTVGQHSVAAFTSPVNGTTPIDANTVRGNDNTVRVAYVDHDADPGIHVQSSTLASRPAAGTAGRKWITEDSGVYTLWFDDGTNWHPVSSENVALTVLATETLVKGDVVKVTGWNNGQDLPEVAKVASTSDVAFAIITANVANGAMGYATNTGIVQDLATNSFSFGDILYPNSSGWFTATKPTSGNYQAAAYVLRSNANNGVLYVEFSAPRIVERSDNTASTIVLRDASGNFSAGTITAGALTSTGLVTFASLKGTGATTVTNILDEDNMASDSATALATQQSIKAYVDAQVATVDTLAEVLANGNTTGANNIIVSSGQKITTNTIDETTSGAGVTIDSVLLKDDVVNATDIEVDTISANNGTLAVTLGSTGVATIAQQPILSSLTASQAVFTDASKGLVSNAITGTGNVVMSASPTLTGTVTAATLNATTLGGTLSTAAQPNVTSLGTLSSLAVTGNLTLGADVVLSRGAADRLDLASGDSLNVVSGTYKIAGTDVLSSNTLGSGVTASSLTSVGTLTSLTVSGSAAIGGTISSGVRLRVVGAPGASSGFSIGAAVEPTLSGTTQSVALSTGVAIAASTTAADARGINIDNANLGSGAAITTQYGVYINDQTRGSTNYALYTAGTAQSYFGGRVGVGTASPGQTLDVSSTSTNVARFATTAAASFSIMQLSGNSSGGSLEFRNGATGLSAVVGTTTGTGDLKFYTNAFNTLAATIDSSGNLGLGVTPSAWGSGFTATQILRAVFWGTGNNAYVGANYYYDGSNERYIASSFATQYSQVSGEHRWSSAASGTAGNTVSFGNPKMTLSAAGGLSVGITTDAGAGNIAAAGDFRLNANSFSRVADLDSGGGFGGGYNLYIDGTTAKHDSTGAIAGYYYESGGVIRFFAGSSAAAGTTATERARITSGGFFKASNDGTYVNSTGSYHELRNTTSDTNIAIFSNAASSLPIGVRIMYPAASPNGTGNYFLYCDDSTALRAEIRSNGGLANYSANNVNLASDFRLKKDIAPLASTWDKLKAIEVVNFRYKDCNENDPALYGVIAQQVQPIVPELVVVTREAVEAKDAELDEDGNEVKPAVEAAPEYYGIREQPMYWLAIKALQEAQARIEALEARLEALEA